MSLFPACSFEIEVPRGIIVPGERMDALLVLDVPHDIPRAENIDVLVQTLAWAGYGEKRKIAPRSFEAIMFQAPLHLKLPKGNAAIGRCSHRHPFAVDLPPWLPRPRMSATIAESIT